MSLTGVGKETVEIVEHGSYVAPSGKTVELRAAIDRGRGDGVTIGEGQALTEAEAWAGFALG